MKVWIAFLRGINVGGHKIIKMTDLAKMFGSFGFDDVKTYIQSGNVLFSAASADEAAITTKIQDGLKKALGYDVPVMVRSADDIRKIITRDPFKGVPEDDDHMTYVGFLSDKPDEKNVKTLVGFNNTIETFGVEGREVFMSRCMPKGKRLKLTMDSLEKIIGVKTTVRNWRTVVKMAELAGS